MIYSTLKRFVVAEDGAVTVDWVVLTAAIVGIGIGVILQLRTSTATVADSTANFIATAPLTPN